MKKQQAKPLSPENYIKTKARTLPIHKCLIINNWKEIGMSQVAIIREHKTGNITFAVYLVDLFALGVKDSACNFNQPKSVIADIESRADFVEIPYSLAHNIVYGSIKFAAKHGFKSHKDFEKLGKYILEPDDEKIPFIEVEFGKDGVPLVITGPFGR
jgi:hypothetical protein